MPTWLFAVIILLVGLGLAFFFDRLKMRPGSGPQEPEERAERSKWIYFWFAGRFPTKEEEAEDERDAKQDKLESGKKG